MFYGLEYLKIQYDYNTRRHKARSTELPKSFSFSWIVPFCLAKCVHKWSIVFTSGLTTAYGAGGLPAACKNVCFSPVPFSLSHREQTLLFLSMMSSNGNMRPAAPLLRGHGLRKELLSLEKVESWSWCIKLCLLYTSPDSSSFCPVHLIGCFSGPCVCVFVRWEQTDPGCELQALAGEQCVLYQRPRGHGSADSSHSSSWFIVCQTNVNCFHHCRLCGASQMGPSHPVYLPL